MRKPAVQLIPCGAARLDRGGGAGVAQIADINHPRARRPDIGDKGRNSAMSPVRGNKPVQLTVGSPAAAAKQQVIAAAVQHHPFPLSGPILRIKPQPCRPRNRQIVEVFCPATERSITSSRRSASIPLATVFPPRLLEAIIESPISRIRDLVFRCTAFAAAKQHKAGKKEGEGFEHKSSSFRERIRIQRPPPLALSLPIFAP